MLLQKILSVATLECYKYLLYLVPLELMPQYKRWDSVIGPFAQYGDGHMTNLLEFK